ncbi:hypothetical protein Kisp02_31630 [Kineosporia sp. NBRC 101731]|nr:hypothetical protein Kisp02_31630 [Kineosporia sp. NBRC 101731]
MRKTGAKYGSLFLNKRPCGRGAANCSTVLQKLLGPGQVLDVTFIDEVDSGRVKTWRFVGGIKRWKEL